MCRRWHSKSRKVRTGAYASQLVSDSAPLPTASPAPTIRPLQSANKFEPPAELILRSAAQLANAPGINGRLEGERVGEIEAVVAAVNVDPPHDVAAVPLHSGCLQPGGVRRCVGVRLELEEDQRACDIHKRV